MTWMMRIPTLLRLWLPVATGAVFLTLWIVGEAGRSNLTEKTIVFALLAIAIGLSGFVPTVSLGVLAGVIVLQAVGVLHPPEANTWPIYLALPIVGLSVGVGATRRVRVAAIPVGLALSALAAALMVVPPGGEGGWASWTGQIGRSWMLGSQRLHPVWDDFIALTLVGAVFFVCSLAPGALYRSSRDGALRRLLDLIDPHPPAVWEASTPRVLDSRLDVLSPREREVFVLLAQGLSNAEIAEACFLSESTVKSHVRAILRKLELRSRSQAIAFAYERSIA